MNIPGMPAGMGAQTQRVCQGDDPERAARRADKDQKDCKVTDKKQTGDAHQRHHELQATGTMVDRPAVQRRPHRVQGHHEDDQQGWRHDHEHDRAQGRRLRRGSRRTASATQKMGAMKKQADGRHGRGRRGAEAGRRSADQAVQRRARRTWSGAGSASTASATRRPTRNASAQHESSDEMSPEIAKSCNARMAEFCKRYQTQEGFLKARGGRDRGADVRRHHRLDQGGAVPEGRAGRLARLPRRLLPGRSEAHRPGALRRPRLHLQDGRQVRRSSARPTWRTQPREAAASATQKATDR